MEVLVQCSLTTILPEHGSTVTFSLGYTNIQITTCDFGLKIFVVNSVSVQFTNEIVTKNSFQLTKETKTNRITKGESDLNNIFFQTCLLKVQSI